MLQSGIGAADELFHLVALTITLSIVAHASTDVVVARLFDEPNEVPGPRNHEARQLDAGHPIAAPGASATHWPWTALESEGLTTFSQRHPSP